MSNAAATNLHGLQHENQTVAFDMKVHVNGTFNIIVSAKEATSFGISYANATVAFVVLEGPADEFDSTTARFSRASGDVLLAMQDKDGVEDRVRLQINYTDLDASATHFQEIARYGIGAFAPKTASQNFTNHGEVAAVFSILKAEPTASSKTRIPGPEAPLVFGAFLVPLLRRRTA